MGRKLNQILLSGIAALTFSTSVHAEDSWRGWEGVRETGNGVRQAFANQNAKTKKKRGVILRTLEAEKKQLQNLEGLVTLETIKEGSGSFLPLFAGNTFNPGKGEHIGVVLELEKEDYFLRLSNILGNLGLYNKPHTLPLSIKVNVSGSKDFSKEGTHYKIFWGNPMNVPSTGLVNGKTTHINIAIAKYFIANISEYRYLINGKLDGKLIEKAKAKYPNVSNFDMEKLRNAFIRSTDKKFPSYAERFRHVQFEKNKIDISKDKDSTEAHLQTILIYANQTDYFTGKIIFLRLESFYKKNPSFKNEAYIQTKSHFQKIEIGTDDMNILSSRGEGFADYFLLKGLNADPKLYRSLSVVLWGDKSLQKHLSLIKDFEAKHPSWKNEYLKAKEHFTTP